MRMLFFLGWALMVLAFAAASAETLARSLPGKPGLFLSAYDLWYAAWPGNLVVTQIRIEKFLHPWLWDPVIVTVLAPPAWALFGVPGLALAWFFRPNRIMTEQQREDMRNREESIFLFDKLARDAKEAGFDGREDDRLPNHSQQDFGYSEGILTPIADEVLPRELDLDDERSDGDDGGDEGSDGGGDDGSGDGGGGKDGGGDGGGGKDGGGDGGGEDGGGEDGGGKDGGGDGGGGDGGGEDDGGEDGGEER